MTGDLVVLVSCLNCRSAVEGIVAQHHKLRIRPVRPMIYVHSQHDPGCVNDPVSILRSQQNLFRHALVVCDHEGSGHETTSAMAVEAQIESQLSSAGWAGRVAAVVIEPELEAWVWSDSPHVATALGWSALTPTMYEWLESQNMLPPGRAKPERPKETAESVMQHCGKRRTSALFARLAEKVSFTRCQDRAFTKLCDTLRVWFPIS